MGERDGPINRHRGASPRPLSGHGGQHRRRSPSQSGLRVRSTCRRLPRGR